MLAPIAVYGVLMLIWPRLVAIAVLPLAAAAASRAAAAELRPETVAAYEQYVARMEARVSAHALGETFLWADASADLRQRLARGEVVARAGDDDGILKAPDGLIHHWWGAVFVPGVRLRDVTSVAQRFDGYAGVYDYVTRSGLLRRERDRYWLYLRMERSASMVTSILDLWSLVEYRYPRPDRVVAVSDTDCIRQVEDAGRPAERRRPPGTGSGFLWRANTLSKYLERDGGVYVELETMGLSRPFPPLLGWIIEPIARRLGRGSAARTLEQLRDAVLNRNVPPAPPPPVPIPSFWCTEDQPVGS